MNQSAGRTNKSPENRFAAVFRTNDATIKSYINLTSNIVMSLTMMASFVTFVVSYRNRNIRILWI